LLSRRDIFLAKDVKKLGLYEMAFLTCLIIMARLSMALCSNRSKRRADSPIFFLRIGSTILSPKKVVVFNEGASFLKNRVNVDSAITDRPGVTLRRWIVVVLV